MQEECSSIHILQSHLGSPSCRWKEVGREKVNDGWISLQTDGAAKADLGLAVIGSLLQSENRCWIRVFMHNIGHSSIVVEI